MILVVGASGATGRLLVAELLTRGASVRAVLRNSASFSETLRNHPALTIVEASLLDLGDEDLLRLVEGCTGVASCLGHNMTMRGIFGPPRRLVADATQRLCEAIRRNAPRQPVRFVLMNTAGNRNRDLDESISLAEHCVVGLIRMLVPPHADNETAADYLRTSLPAKNDFVEWAVVRPDSLLNKDTVTAYKLHPSPTRSAIFNAGKTSRINVAHFMAALLMEDTVWAQWQGQMPVIYNRDND